MRGTEGVETLLLVAEFGIVWAWVVNNEDGCNDGGNGGVNDEITDLVVLPLATPLLFISLSFNDWFAILWVFVLHCLDILDKLNK